MLHLIYMNSVSIQSTLKSVYIKFPYNFEQKEMGNAVKICIHI